MAVSKDEDGGSFVREAPSCVAVSEIAPSCIAVSERAPSCVAFSERAPSYMLVLGEEDGVSFVRDNDVKSGEGK